MRYPRWLLWCLAILFCGATSAVAGQAQDALATDLKPLQGVILAGQDGEWLIDLGSNQGVQVGDLFGLTEASPPLVQPETGEVLGQPHHIRGLLRATWVQERFSGIVPLGDLAPPATGSPVVRYLGMTASFLDRTGSGEEFYLDLAKQLPQFRWLGYQHAEKAGVEPPAAQVNFILRAGNLEVRDPNGRLIHSYSEFPSTPKAEAGRSGAVTEPPMESKPSTSSFREVATLPTRVLAAAFQKQDRHLYLATSAKHYIELFDLAEGCRLIGRKDFDRPGKILAVSWWKPQEAKTLYLAVTRQVDENAPGSPVTGTRIASAIFRLQNSHLVAVRRGLPYLLGSFDLDGNGLPETLLGQPLDRDVTFSGRLREFHLASGSIRGISCKLPLPQGFPVLGSALRRSSPSAPLQSAWILNRTLFTASNSRLDYQSAADMGGGLQGITYDVNPDAADRMFRTVPLEQSPIVLTTSDQGPNWLVVAAETGLLNLTGLVPEVRTSRMVAVEAQGTRYQRRKIGPRFDAAIQGLARIDQRVLVVVTPVHGDNPSRVLSFKPES